MITLKIKKFVVIMPRVIRNLNMFTFKYKLKELN